jgi:hypothetical protein
MAVIDGTSGNDHLTGTADPDTVNGNGGTGTDTLKMFYLEDGQHLDLTGEPDNRILNIERIDLRDGSNTLTLGERDLLALSSSTNTLKVLGNSEDSVNIVGAFTDEGVSGNFHHYRIGAAILLVDTDITDVH